MAWRGKVITENALQGKLFKGLRLIGVGGNRANWRD